ncbi:Fe-S cluster assembly sulfur transfer protein SufU [Arcanobacterium ihumii]|uniref:Fe-S cluster assembly sulfur transfer protein SufU n=1 Tax=Arcanobacterium ihumii TaxID=2138162 RepID=UPI002E0F9D41
MLSNLEQLYQEIILDASKERYGEGLLETPDGESFQVNPTCGDQVTMQVELSEDGEHISEIAWDGHGCSISQASISIMTQMLEGKSLEEADKIFHEFRQMMDARGSEISDETADLLEDASAFQGVSKFPARIKCALLGWMALREATDNALENKENKG